MSHRLSHVLRRAGALAAGIAGSLFTAAALAASPIKIGTVIWIGYGPFYVADQLDLFKKSGVKVTMQVFNDPALIPPAVTGGSVDGGMVTYDQVISSVAKGSSMKVVMPIDYSNGGDAQSRAEMLAWKALGLTPGGRPFWLAVEEYVGACAPANKSAAQALEAKARADGLEPYVTDASGMQTAPCFW